MHRQTRSSLQAESGPRRNCEIVSASHARGLRSRVVSLSNNVTPKTELGVFSGESRKLRSRIVISSNSAIQKTVATPSAGAHKGKVNRNSRNTALSQNQDGEIDKKSQRNKMGANKNCLVSGILEKRKISSKHRYTCFDCGKTSRSYYALYCHEQYHKDKKWLVKSKIHRGNRNELGQIGNIAATTAKQYASKSRTETSNREKLRQKLCAQAPAKLLHANTKKNRKISQNQNKMSKTVQGTEKNEKMSSSDPAIGENFLRVGNPIRKCVCSCGKKYFTLQKLNHHIRIKGSTSMHCRAISHLYINNVPQNDVIRADRKLPNLSPELNTMLNLNCFFPCFVHLDRVDHTNGE